MKDINGTIDFSHLAGSNFIGRKSVVAYSKNRNAILNFIHKFPLAATWFANLAERQLDRRGVSAPPDRGDSVYSKFWSFEFAFRLLEHPSIKLVCQLVKPGANVIDCGAHVGYYSMLFSELIGDKGKLLAIEPHPKNLSRLQANVNTSCAKIIGGAVSDTIGQISLHQGSGHSNHSIVGNPSSLGESAEITVDTYTLDDLGRNHGFDSVDFLKLDVEGAEVDVISGGTNLLKRSPNVVVLIELNPRMLEVGGSDSKHALAMLQDLGLLVRQVRDDYVLGDIGVIAEDRTENYVAASPEKWIEIGDTLSNRLT